MRAGLLNQLNSLVSDNERLIEIYRSMYYLLPAKEKILSEKMMSLLEKREELELELKKCSFNLKKSSDDKQCTGNIIFRFMPLLLELEKLARVSFKNTRQNLIYLEEKKYLKKYFELLYKQNLSEKVFELLLKYKRRQKTEQKKSSL